MTTLQGQVLLSETVNPYINLYLNQLIELQQTFSVFLSGLNDSIVDIERKLKLLRDFSSGTTNLFVESLHKLEFAMQVVSILNQTRVNQDGTYSLPPGVDVTWFMTLKNEDEETHRFISGILGIEDITTLGLTQEQLDWYKRLRQSAGLNPSNLLKNSL